MHVKQTAGQVLKVQLLHKLKHNLSFLDFSTGLLDTAGSVHFPLSDQFFCTPDDTN